MWYAICLIVGVIIGWFASSMCISGKDTEEMSEEWKEYFKETLK